MPAECGKLRTMAPFRQIPEKVIQTKFRRVPKVMQAIHRNGLTIYSDQSDAIS